MFHLQQKCFLKLLDLSPDDITGLLDLAAELKEKKKAGIAHNFLTGKNVALIFEKTSTRTRCAFEVAAYDLGMNCTYLDPSGSQIGKKESIADTATGSNTAVSGSRSLKILPVIPAFRPGTDSPTNSIPPKSLPIF